MSRLSPTPSGARSFSQSARYYLNLRNHHELSFPSRPLTSDRGLEWDDGVSVMTAGENSSPGVIWPIRRTGVRWGCLMQLGQREPTVRAHFSPSQPTEECADLAVNFRSLSDDQGGRHRPGNDGADGPRRGAMLLPRTSAALASFLDRPAYGFAISRAGLVPGLDLLAARILRFPAQATGAAAIRVGFRRYPSVSVL
jgi:hypothetical protein